MIAVSLPGLTDYRAVHALQRDLVERRIREEIDDVVLLVEHAPVITVGRARGAAANVLAASETPVVEVERGGDVTWHGPGQLVAYPIVHLVGDRADLHRHLHALEAAVIGLLADRGVAAVRDDRNTGVWLPDVPLARKVCSVAIHPCGFEAGVMTRLADHLDPCPTVNALRLPLAGHLAAALGVSWDGALHEHLPG